MFKRLTIRTNNSILIGLNHKINSSIYDNGKSYSFGFKRNEC